MALMLGGREGGDGGHRAMKPHRPWTASHLPSRHLLFPWLLGQEALTLLSASLPSPLGALTPLPSPLILVLPMPLACNTFVPVL